jgi:DNA-binding beta-propeller fold protein YncE
MSSLLIALMLMGLHTSVGADRGATAEAEVADSVLLVSMEYRAYVVAESSDLVHRIVVGPEGALVENTVTVEELLMDTDGPHGVAVDPRGRYVYVTTGHGIWNGNLWKLEVGPDTVVAGPLPLGQFPATVDVDPHGLFAYVANFNLHGDMVPSSISVVDLASFVEVARTETCTMPHGSRVSPDGTRHYSVCMMDDQLVELETRGFTVNRRFNVNPQNPGPLERVAEAPEGHGPGGHHGDAQGAVCSPTWASPSPDGGRVYVACNADDRVMEIDVGEWALLREFETGRGPYNLEVTPDSRMLIVTLKQGDAVEFIDLDSAETVARVPTSTRVTHGVAISPDGRLAFISVEGVGTEPGRVDVVDLHTLERIHSLEVGLQAAGIAVLRSEHAR